MSHESESSQLEKSESSTTLTVSAHRSDQVNTVSTHRSDQVDTVSAHRSDQVNTVRAHSAVELALCPPVLIHQRERKLPREAGVRYAMPRAQVTVLKAV